MEHVPYRCLVVDDEPMSRLALSRLIAHSPHLQLAGAVADAKAAQSFLEAYSPEIMFLDVEMPDMTGLELLASLGEPPRVVLVSSQAQYALNAFEFEVTDYLLKPITIDRFTKAVNRLTSSLLPHSGTRPTYLMVKKKGHHHRLDSREIIWIEALGDYMRLHTHQERFVIHSTMKKLEAKLPADQFLRVHRSYLVQRAAIEKVSTTRLELEGGASVPIGKSYRKRIKEELLAENSC